MKKRALLLLVLPLLLSGCGSNEPTTSTTSESSSSSSVPYVPKEGKVTANMSAFINENKYETGYDLEFDYKDAYFVNPANVYNADIMKLSFASSLVSTTNDNATSFFQTMGYDVVKTELEDPTAESAGYAFAHRDMGEFDMIGVTIRGFKYLKEWANNFEIGLTGNHAGFEAKTSEVFEELKTFIKPYQAKTLKLWVTGFSRGGGLANMLADKLIRNKETLKLDTNNIFVYTFEAPRGITTENIVAYDNVFNMVNSVDMVARIPPAEYSLGRCGQDIIINTEDKDVDALLHEFDPEINLIPFVPVEETYETPEKFTDFILSTLLEDTGDPETSFSTREGFYNNYQSAIIYAMNIFFKLSDETKNKIVEAFSSLGMMEILGLLSEEDGLYNFFKPIFDEDHVEYDETLLKSTCNAVIKLAGSKILLGVLIYLNEDFRNNAIRMLYMHAAESVYVLIK